jgi:hypothetical protein
LPFFQIDNNSIAPGANMTTLAIGRRNSWLTAAALVALFLLAAAHLTLLLLHAAKASSPAVRSHAAMTVPKHEEPWWAERISDATETGAALDVMQDGSNAANDDKIETDPFPPPLFGYDSMEQMMDRKNRFPSINERVQVYMSNWYHPPCGLPYQMDNDNGDLDDGFIHYRFLTSSSTSNPEHDDNSSRLLVQEVETVATVNKDEPPRLFLLDSNPTLGKLHFLTRTKMHPDQCDSEYCSDILEHWYPAMDRVYNDSTYHPVMFQFSDEELSRAISFADNDLKMYPNLPHLKKSRLALLPQDIAAFKTCNPIPKSYLPTAMNDPNIPEHLHPSKCIVIRKCGSSGRSHF